jgi:hypothetical protein
MVTTVVGNKCSIINCNNPSISKGFCAMHYKRLQRHGDASDKHSKLINGEQRTKHPLYNTWKNIVRSSLGNLACEEWKDFNKFVEDIKDRPSENVTFVRIDATKSFSIDNVYWKKSITTEKQKCTRREYMREYSKKSRANNPEYYKNADLKRTYNVTLEWYNEQLEKQNNACAICKQPETAIIKGKLLSLAVDHCHESGNIRGLLCRSCNNAIGALKHDEGILLAAIEYLRK